MIEQSKHYALAITCGAKRGPKDTDLTFSPASLRDFLKALAEQPAQQQEPVAWATYLGECAHVLWGKDRPDYPIRYEVPLYTRPQAREWVGLTDGDWAALWEEFAWESDVTINEAHQEEMVCKHGEGHYYMDPEESWNRQKDLIQKLVSAKLKEKNGITGETK